MDRACVADAYVDGVVSLDTVPWLGVRICSDSLLQEGVENLLCMVSCLFFFSKKKQFEFHLVWPLQQKESNQSKISLLKENSLWQVTCCWWSNFFSFIFQPICKVILQNNQLTISPPFYLFIFFKNRSVFHMLLLVLVWNLPFLHRDLPQCLWAWKVKSKRRRDSITDIPPYWFKIFLQMNQQTHLNRCHLCLLWNWLNSSHSTSIYWEPTMSQALLAFRMHLRTNK